MKITMSSLNTIAQLLQNEQQGHTISTSADGHNVKIVVGQQLVLRDEIGNFIPHTKPVPSDTHPRDDRYWSDDQLADATDGECAPYDQPGRLP